MTAPASSSRCPTRSCVRCATSTCPRRAPTRPASPSCLGIRPPPTLPPRRSDASSPRRACGSSAGARSRPTTAPSGRWPATSNRPSAQLFIAADQGSPRTVGARPRAPGVRGPQARRTRARRRMPGSEVYFPSLSGRTLIYKGMLTSPQLQDFFLDLSDERLASALAIVHSRFSTNTFPSWPLAHPYRLIGQPQLDAGPCRAAPERKVRGGLGRSTRSSTPGGSDSAQFDNMVELLHLGGRSLPHAVMMMIPEAWEHHDPWTARRAFYDYHAASWSPGTVRRRSPSPTAPDRRHPGPQRASAGPVLVTRRWLGRARLRVGVLARSHRRSSRRGACSRAGMLIVDTVAGPHRRTTMSRQGRDLAIVSPTVAGSLATPTGSRTCHPSLRRRRSWRASVTAAAGPRMDPGRHRRSCSRDGDRGKEPISSMGADTPLAVLSDQHPSLFNFFKQSFAQVTNPAIDPIREEHGHVAARDRSGRGATR